MSKLAKLNLKTVQRVTQKDPVIQRREKLTAAIAEQVEVQKAALQGKEYRVPVKRWKENEDGEKVQVTNEKRIRPWFFEQDGGWYVQCRYGSRVLSINGDKNAVFVNKLEEVADVFAALIAATKDGELDKAITLTARAKA
jgi:hypothetical protein